jgi:hypothetical protein
MGGLVMKAAREQIRYEAIKPSVSVEAERAAFLFRRNVAIWTGYMDSVGAIFISTEEHGLLARKLVNMPDGMLSIHKI